MDIVTGYFTIGALVWLSELYNKEIEKFRIVWGGIANHSGNKIMSIDLLNQELSIDKALRLKEIAQKAVEFLKQSKVEIKTTEPNFCHAKLYLLRTDNQQKSFYITGSSNLTEAGIGLYWKRKTTAVCNKNNNADKMSAFPDADKMSAFPDADKMSAFPEPTSNVELNVINGGLSEDFSSLVQWFNTLWSNDKKVHERKKEFIKEISQIFKEYTPLDIYLKILSELYDEDFFQERIEKRIQDTEIYKKLFDFQKKAVVSLIKILDKKNGAILADAVGLGKTFTTLAVIKYYQKQGRETIILSPKKLEYNWKQYLRDRGSIFEKDNFDYRVQFHTDLKENRLEDIDYLLKSEKPKLLVIDESHNLRNDKAKRYKFLKEEILRKDQDIKVLMLSATPINNSLLDVRNQIKLIGDFERIDFIFRKGQEELNKWVYQEKPVISSLIKELPSELLELADSLIIARKRKDILKENIAFPELQKPINIFETPNCVENISSFTDLLELLPARFSAYMPAYYAGLTDKKIIHNESQRSLFLVKMMHIMIAKRLESSWMSFKTTLERLLTYHKYVLEKIERYEEIEPDSLETTFNDEDSPDLDEWSVGKKNPIPINSITDRDKYIKDLKEDIQKLQYLTEELKKFSADKDTKLKKLIEIVERKQSTPQASLAGENAIHNKKLLIFTTFTDTAEYLFSQLSKQFDKIAVVYGKMNNRDIEDILKRFSPISKNANDKQLANPIDILISTEILSEGQNLQDCDCVINYDIHWNPVSVIQRLGRIDRIGSLNKTISCINFWPSKNINEYLSLQRRVEIRMVAMTIAGSQIPKNFTENLNNMNKENELEQKQIQKNLEIMQNNLEDIFDKGLSFNDLSLEAFRSDLTRETINFYRNLPNGIFSGFVCPPIPTFMAGERGGIIVLLRHKTSYEKKLIFVDNKGNEIFINQKEILAFLKDNKDAIRDVDDTATDETMLSVYSNAIKSWLNNSIISEEKRVEAELLKGIMPITKIGKKSETIEQKYKEKNWLIIAWEIIR